MIETDGTAGFDAIAAILERRAITLAEARAASARLARRADARRWRRPELLWPLFVERS